MKVNEDNCVLRDKLEIRCEALSVYLCRQRDDCPFYKSKEEYERVSVNILDVVRKRGENNERR